MSEEKRKSQFLAALAALAPPPAPLTLLERYTIDNRVYKNDRIDLDGYTFRNCAFINCVLHTAKGNFYLESCHFHLCTLHFSGNALRVVRFSSILLGNWDQLNEGLRAQVHPDGSVSIR